MPLGKSCRTFSKWLWTYTLVFWNHVNDLCWINYLHASHFTFCTLSKHKILHFSFTQINSSQTESEERWIWTIQGHSFLDYNCTKQICIGSSESWKIVTYCGSFTFGCHAGRLVKLHRKFWWTMSKQLLDETHFKTNQSGSKWLSSCNSMRYRRHQDGVTGYLPSYNPEFDPQNFTGCGTAVVLFSALLLQ